MALDKILTNGTETGGTLASKINVGFDVTDANEIAVTDLDTRVTNIETAPSGVLSVVAGTNVQVDATDPANPIVSATTVWGGITGTLSSQTDLQFALDNKADTSGNALSRFEVANAVGQNDAVNLQQLTPVETKADNAQGTADNAEQIAQANTTAITGKQDDLGFGAAGQILATNATVDDTEWVDVTVTGDMFKSTYDINDDGVVDSADFASDAGTVNHLTVETAVPSGAVFTDTVYDDTAIQADVDSKWDGTENLEVTVDKGLRTSTQNLLKWQVATGSAPFVGKDYVTFGDTNGLVNILGTVFQPFVMKNDTAIQAYEDTYTTVKNLVSRTNGTDYNNEVIVGDSDVVTAIRSTTGFEPVIREGTYGSTTDYALLSEKNVATDPGDSTAATVAELVTDYNTLLANLRTAGLIA